MIGTGPLWRGSLLPLGCAAAPPPASTVRLIHREADRGAASRPSGSKLPRHRFFARLIDRVSRMARGLYPRR
ncbi:hypothetical protein BFW87_28835 [Pseudomonas fluorescens]|uniref:Uncharacterized protein n=1 Tax=Pseudomonas fluorescens TaxID=294 RepID=A0A1T2XXD5_PSEFL|nr:hypothetical protein BFW87_28835 [Pseudomonas fluorescens]